MQTSSPTCANRETSDRAFQTPPPQQTDPWQSLYKVIAEQPFFQGFKEDQLRLLAASAMRTQFEPAQLILQRGNPANRFYFILKGGVMLETADKNGSIHRLARLGAGDILGWSWLFPPYSVHFDAVATEPTDAIFFYGPRLRAACRENPDFGLELTKRITEVVITRLQTTYQHWVNEE